MSNNRWSSWLLVMSGVAAGALALTWLARRGGQHQLGPNDVYTQLLPTELRDEAESDGDGASGPSSYVLEPSPSSEQQLTARPRDPYTLSEAADDYDALSPEDLGVAFLVGATEGVSDVAPRSTSEMVGFQIFEPGALGGEEPGDEPSDAATRLLEAES